MKKVLFAFLLTLIALGGALAAAANVSGAWTITMRSPMGERSNAMRIVQDGEKLTVTTQSPRGEQTYQGTIKESAVTWSGKRQRPDGTESTVVYSGKLEGEMLKGTVQMGDRGSFDWSAVRVKPAGK